LVGVGWVDELYTVLISIQAVVGAAVSILQCRRVTDGQTD